MARLKIKLQLYCGDEIAMGPGKADLLEAIASAGSISAAGRLLGMSYRRAWLLVDTMNRCFHSPLVETRPGGGQGAGAWLTAEGESALAAYRGLSEQVERGVAGADFAALQAAIRETPVESTLGHSRASRDRESE
jgi:molybdate transport system regulatory protein